MKKQIISMILVVSMVVSMLPSFVFPVLAATTNVYVSSNGSDTNIGTYSAPYATINKAYETVDDGGTICIMDDLTVSQLINFNANKKVTIRTTDVDGAGVVYTGETAIVKRSATNLREPFTITAGTVTFADITLDGNTSGVENGKPAPWLDYQGFSFMSVSDTGILVLDSGATVQNVSAMGDTSEAVGPINSRYGGINVSSTMLIKEGSKITNIVAASGAIRLIPKAYVNSVTCYVEMSGGVIEYCDSYNATWQEGSTIYINQSGSTNKANFKMTGGVIENCGQRFYNSNYGTIYLHPDNTTASSFIMTGGTIKNNKCGTVGGIYIASGNVQLSGDAQVFNNIDKNGNKANVLLKSSQTISIIGALSDKANIGISAQYMPSIGQADVPIALSGNGYTLQSSDSRAFTSDKATTAGILLKNNQIVMSAEAKANEVTITGKVSDYVGGKNTLSGITVSLYDAEDITFSRPLTSSVTDTNGDYSIKTTVKPGNYMVHVDEKLNCYNYSTSSSIAISTSDVTGVNITLTKSSKSSVVLNKPVFTNDKSGYSFKLASINNFDAVTAITFSASKSTTVTYIPTFLTPTSRLESIDGDIRTATYVFEKGISVSQAEEFIRGIIFDYKAGAEISITVDNNATKLPDGAKITEFAHPDGTDHYYMYVPSDFISWTSAYGLAKSYTYMGLKGYLATVTSLQEDETLTNISKISAWSAGTRYLNADGTKLADPSSVSYTSKAANYYYWACGPEAGTIYYNSTTPTSNPGEGYTGYNNAYNNWGANPQQPDAATSGETCMQVNWPLDTGANGKMRWNDLPNEGLPNLSLVRGYFVEFSQYSGGMDAQYSSDKTAVTTYNLITDGGVEEVATVTLNTPVYGSGNHSVFTFEQATITNIQKVYSLTIKLDNYTNVLSKPETPAVSNELKNIAGDTNTITYQFENGITQSEAQSFLRGIKFRYGGLSTSSTTNVSVTIDGNITELPQGANITEYNGHYYMYVPNAIPWNEAYNAAKSYSYMGLRGYLATITSAEEDNILTQISDKGAWSGGAALLKADGTKINDEATYLLSTGNAGNQYYWTCGPEAGTVYYNSRTVSNHSAIGYTNWALNQPDNYYFKDFMNRVGIEFCMQINYHSDYYNSHGWNDLNHNPTFEVTGEDGLYPYGYFVEFSDYSKGRIDDYVASANTKSTVPISVEKGDVFNFVKDGGTYYVDTVITAYDRNITGIKVNNVPVSSGYTIPGNVNTTDTIIATDLGGNSTSMTVVMKTIASISDPIQNLSVNNVQMSNITAILATKATLESIDQTTASASQKTEISEAIKNCNNLYFALFYATSTVVNGTNGWYKSGIDTITLTAPDGFTISTTNNGAWSNSITVDHSNSDNKSADYYLKDSTTSEISPLKNFSYKVDTTAPTGTITIKSNQFTSFLNTITFGMFFKNTIDITITGADTLSVPVTVSYQKVAADETYHENGTWTNGSSFSVSANEKFSVYAKMEDAAGNVTIINSNGVVVYTDSLQNTADFEFIKTSTSDVSAEVTLNGNSVREIKNGNTVIDDSNYTVASDGVITFKASYLDTLSVGNYTFTISYNPMGESFVQDGDNQAPSATTVSLAVKAKAVTDEDGKLNASVIVAVTPESDIYDGKPFAPAVTVKDGDKKLTAGTDYTVSWTTDMTNVGEKVATITFKGIYSGNTTKTVNITNAALTETTNKTQSVTYNGKGQSIFAIPGATALNNQTIFVSYSTDGNEYNLTSAPSFTNKGIHTVYYQLSAPNHDSITGQIQFIINATTDNTITNLIMAGWTYGDNANTPSATTRYGVPEFTYSDSENGIYTSTIPTLAGTYYVKASVAATDNYNGAEMKTSFTITDKTINNQDIAISGINKYYLFADSEIKPVPTVTVNGTVLVQNTDYTISYKDNTAIGTNAKVIITLRGNYSGSGEKTFEIRYGTATDNEIKSMITLPDFNANGWRKEDIVITGKDGFTLCEAPTGRFGDSLTISKESTKTGTDYIFYIKAADGSIYERTLNYKLDKGAPEGRITVGNAPIESFLKRITFGLVFNKDAKVTVTSSDTLSGIEKVEVYKSDTELTKDQLSTVNWTGYTAAITESAKDKAKFIYYARITDNAGNVVIINSQGAKFDLTPPVIHGVTNGETYYTTQIITTTDTNDVTITVNGQDFVSGGKITGNQNASYVITATDKAGNTTTVTITMKPINDISKSLDDIHEDDVEKKDQKIIKEIKKKAESVDTTNATEKEKTVLLQIIDKCNLLLKKIDDNTDITDMPKTGDTSNPFPLIALLFIFGSASTILGVMGKKRRKYFEK